jgi:hypothetical protein
LCEELDYVNYDDADAKLDLTGASCGMFGLEDVHRGDLMNSDFWVVIATAAPVVILTCIVLCSTQGGNLAQLFHEWKTRHHTVILASIIAAAVVNLAVFSAEAIAFLDALGHLEENTDGNTGLAISVQMGCLIGLGVSSVVTHVARCTWWPGKEPEPSSVPPGDSITQPTTIS